MQPKPPGPALPEVVGIVGYGRFGSSFASLLADAGLGVRAYDPAAAPEPPLGVRSPAQLAEAARVVILAVPIPAYAGTLRELRPHLGGRHVVLDVGSVKEGPVALMGEILGDDVPWVATHPLFGPTSLALGERPLRVVVCPNPRHPEATALATALYARLGCRILELDPAAHDRQMAEVHALTYFVAKGLIDIGVDFGSELAPPSAQGLARTIASVRSDAGHLFAALHRDNLHSAATRRRLLDALLDVDHALRNGASGADSPPPPALAIPDFGARSPALREVRELIDDLDRDIMSLLARRAQLSRRARSAKAGLGQGVRDPRREEELLAGRRRWAAEQGLDPVSVESVFLEILRFSRRVQES